MLGIVINPRSGKKAYRMQRLYLFRLLKKNRQPFAYKVTKYAGHAIELARELVEKGYDQILILGGDGTLSEVINGIMTAKVSDEDRKKVQFGLMPRGTGNDWARFWKLDKNYKRSLKLFFEGKSQPVDVGELTYWRNGEEKKRYFINSIGFGIDPLTCKLAKELQYYLGSHSINYFFALFAGLIKYKAIPVEVLSDGQLIAKDKMFCVNVANGPYMGGGMKVNVDADPRDGVFHSLFASKPNFKQALRVIRNLFNGNLYNIDFIHTFTSKEVVINSTKHMMVELDGINLDFMGSCVIRNIHHPISMRVPDYC